MNARTNLVPDAHVTPGHDDAGGEVPQSEHDPQGQPRCAAYVVTSTDLVRVGHEGVPAQDVW